MHLFIFNFKKLYIFIIPIFIIICIEIIVRKYSYPIEKYDSIESRLLEIKALLKQKPKNSIIVIGNSIAQSGIQTKYFFENTEISRKYKIYNMSIGGFYTPTILEIMNYIKFYPEYLIIDINYDRYDDFQFGGYEYDISYKLVGYLDKDMNKIIL